MSVHYESKIPQILAKLPLQVEEAERLTAEAVAESARANVPVRTGKLRDSIAVEKAEHGYRVGPSEFYGHFVEFGTRHSPAHPFLTPAAEEHRETLAQALRRLI